MTKVSGPLDQPPTPLVSTQYTLADKPEVISSYTSQEVTTNLTTPETRNPLVHNITNMLIAADRQTPPFVEAI